MILCDFGCPVDNGRYVSRDVRYRIPTVCPQPRPRMGTI